MTTARKVAIYVRVSTTNQAEEGYSISEQQNALNKYADAMGWSVYKEYIDAGFSGGKLERPAITNLVTDSENKRFDTVLVYKLDRLSRSVRDTIYLIRDVFQANDIQFVSLQESIDTNSPIGNFFLTQMSAIAEFERDQISERMKMGKIGRAKSGKSMMWGKTAYGYRYDKKAGEMYIEEAEGAIVRLIYTKYLEGMSISKLRDYLNENEMETRDLAWTYRIIRGILSNPVYAGFNKYKGEIYEGNHEPLVTRETFEETQREIEKRQQQTYAKNNNPRPFQAKYMLSGIIQCGYCHAPLTTKLSAKRKDGSRSIRYECYNRTPRKTKRVTTYNNDKKCDSGFYYLHDLEDYTLSEINKLKNNPQDYIPKDSHDSQKDLDLAKREINKIAGKIEKLNNLYMIDNITLEELQKKTTDFINRKKELENKIIYLNENKTDNEKIKKLLDFDDVKELSYEEQRLVAKNLIKKVIVTAEGIDILWNL